MKFGNLAAIVGSIAAATIAFSSAPAAAASADGKYAVHGIGTQDCALLSKPDFKSAPANQAVLASWIMGYITANNSNTNGVFDRTPVQSPVVLVAMVESICTKKPDMKIDAALNGVLRFLDPGKSAAPAALVEFKNDKYRTVVRADVAQKIQMGLNQKGWYKGAIDGKSSPELTTAIRGYQKSQKLTETGIPDLDVIINLILKTK